MIRWTYFFLFLFWSENCASEHLSSKFLHNRNFLQKCIYTYFFSVDSFREIVIVRAAYIYLIWFYIFSYPLFVVAFIWCRLFVRFFFACSLLWFFSFDILVWSYLVAYLRQEFRVFHRTITVVFRCFFLLFIHRIFLSLYIVVVARSARIQFVCFFFALCWLNSWMYCVMCKYNKMSKSQ